MSYDYRMFDWQFDNQELEELYVAPPWDTERARRVSRQRSNLAHTTTRRSATTGSDGGDSTPSRATPVANA